MKTCFLISNAHPPRTGGSAEALWNNESSRLQQSHRLRTAAEAAGPSLLWYAAAASASQAACCLWNKLFHWFLICPVTKPTDSCDCTIMWERPALRTRGQPRVTLSHTRGKLSELGSFARRYTRANEKSISGIYTVKIGALGQGCCCVLVWIRVKICSGIAPRPARHPLKPRERCSTSEMKWASCDAWWLDSSNPARAAESRERIASRPVDGDKQSERTVFKTKSEALESWQDGIKPQHTIFGQIYQVVKQ